MQPRIIRLFSSARLFRTLSFSIERMSLVWSPFPTKQQAWWLLPLLVLPWLNTYTAGPTPNTWPWLVSAVCATLLWQWRRYLNGELIASQEVDMQ